MRKFYLLLILGITLSLNQMWAQSQPKQVLRILAIGNSFSDDGMEYLPALFADMGVNDVEVARLYVGGCSLERHLGFYRRNESPYVFTHSKADENRWVQHKKKLSLKEALSLNQWDIITLQQNSGQSGQYESFEPYLGELIRIIKASQPNARIAWHMTWAYSTESKHGEFPKYGRSQQKMIQAIHDATRKALEAHPEIEIIIPAGTAIQSLRQSAINNYPQDLTRDGYHMGLGAGRYALACTWYEALVEPFTKRSMRGNTLRINQGSVAVTPIVAAYCQKAAKLSTRKAFSTKEVKHIDGYLRKAKHKAKGSSKR